MTKKTFDFIGNRKIFLLISAVIILGGLIVNIFLPTELDINFKGGAIFTYAISGEVDKDGLTAMGKEHLSDKATVDFSKDIAGANTQVTYTLTEIPSTVLTYSVTGTADVATLKTKAEEIFGCETKVEAQADAKTVTVDPVKIITDAMADEFSNAIAGGAEGAPTYTLVSSNTVSELADALYKDMTTTYGTAITYTVDAETVDTEALTTAIENALIAGIPAAQQNPAVADVVATYDKEAKLLTVTPATGNQPMDAEYGKIITQAVQGQIAAATQKSETYNTITLITSNSVKPTVGKGFFIKCLFAMVLGGIFLTLYIGIRFRKIGGISAGIFATFALIHDILIAYLVYVFFRIPLDDNFIAVVLTILGYSINGTIVIYDRIRENEQKFGSSLTIDEIVNRSVNNTVARNIFTSLTTLIAVVTIAVVAKL
ncbi:MAG: hypothetical protein IKU10_02900, partial [Clostridia bacterium]|nr:hypothetical protein [Clostridia bacterium]